MEPDQARAGGTLVVETQIANQGCAAAGASTTSLELMDGSGQLLATKNVSAPSITAGASALVSFTITLPASVAGNQVTIRTCADSTGSLSQCDTLHACAEIPLPLPATTGQPKLTFVVNGDIFPGEPVSITWKIKNFCSDLVRVIAKVSFLGNPLYTSSLLPIGLQDEIGEDNQPVVPTSAVINNFYKIGSKPLQLEVLAIGNDPGPYKVNASLVVKPEPVSGAMWAFTAPLVGTPGTSPWKRPYTVTGRLSNPAHTAMTPVSLVLNEVDTSTSPATPTSAIVASPPVSTIVPGALGTASWPGIVQSWGWLTPGIWTPTAGPTTKIFGYSVSFDLQDTFGNPYPTQTSATVSEIVSVSAGKLAAAVTATVSQAVAVGFAIAGFLALAGIYTGVAAPFLFGAAALAQAAAFGFAAVANDPPAADFLYRETVLVTPLALPKQLDVRPAPLVSMFDLVVRILAAAEALPKIEGKLIGAAIDNQVDALRLQLATHEEVRRALTLAADHLPAATEEAIAGMRGDPLFVPLFAVSPLRKVLASWRRRGVPADLRSRWQAEQLPAELLSELGSTIQKFEVSLEPIDAMLPRLAQALQRVGQETEHESQLFRVELETGLTLETLRKVRSTE